MPRHAAPSKLQAPGLFSWHRGEASWKLGSTAVVTLSTIVLLAVCVAGAHLASQVARHGASFTTATAAVFFFMVTQAAAAAFSYIYVAARAARSSQLHLHGFVLLMVLLMLLCLVVATALQQEGRCGLENAARVCIYCLWGIGEVAFFALTAQKLLAFGPPPSRCLDASLWSRATCACAAVACLPLAVTHAWEVAVSLQGYHSTCRMGDSSADFGEALYRLSGLGSFGVLITGTGMMYVACRLWRQVLSRLSARRVEGEALGRVKRTLAQHVAGVFASVLSMHLSLLAGVVDVLDLFGEVSESEEVLVRALSGCVDVVGDTIGILLLSGIGTLLLHEDPEAGDISGHIRGLLHSAVLTGRAATVFEGNVESTRSSSCVASFPGKYLSDWQALTWACEQGDMCSACVFLPEADAKGRFGEHAPRPETPGKCWCHTIYGHEQPWGCMWFPAWQSNVHRAMDLDLELVVVFFPGEAGKGEVEWDALGTASLWDGVGLGGSQKVEVAYLRRCGARMTELDLDAFRRRVSQLGSSNQVPAAHIGHAG